MPSPSPKLKKKKVVNAYAVIQTDMQKDMPLAKVFTHHEIFFEAVFSHEYAAKKYCEFLKKCKFKVKVVEVKISYFS